MVGGGPFRLPVGAWTDDTSMALCLGSSLVEKQGFDPADQMERYCAWRDEGYLSSTGVCFDIGSTVSAALNRYKLSGEPFSGTTDPYSAGNGSIMRLAPVPMFYHADEAQVIHFSGESSRTTHGAAEAVDASQLFGGMVWAALMGGTKAEILAYRGTVPTTAKIQAIATGSYQTKSRDDIKGSGYVVAALEAALGASTTPKTTETPS